MNNDHNELSLSKNMSDKEFVKFTIDQHKLTLTLIKILYINEYKYMYIFINSLENNSSATYRKDIQRFLNNLKGDKKLLA